jgi:hypothetical protein
MSEKKDLSRADLVRLRRESDSSGEIPQPRRRSDRTNPTSTRSARRRFQNALLPVAPDAELRGISISRPNLGRRLPSFLVVALLATALYFAFNTPQLRVTQAQVSGNLMLTPAEVNDALNIAGQPTFLLMPTELEKRLRIAFPEITAAHVDVTLPNTVSVQVVERKPVIRWEQGEGYTWVSEDGIAFRPHGDMAGLITVVALSAPPIEGIVSSDEFMQALAWAGMTRAAGKSILGRVDGMWS